MVPSQGYNEVPGRTHACPECQRRLRGSQNFHHRQLVGSLYPIGLEETMWGSRSHLHPVVNPVTTGANRERMGNLDPHSHLTVTKSLLPARPVSEKDN